MDTQNGKILIVDDDPTNLKVLLKFLSQIGYKVLVAKDGASAITQSIHGQPDLILLDVMMPILDGYETCRRLKADKDTANIPVIFITALDQTSQILKGFSVGAIDYVTKPFQVEEIAVRINTHLRLRKMQQEIEASNIVLEQRVVERTTALTHANKILEAEVEQRKSIETALRESESMTRAIINSSPDAIVLLESTGVILDCNQQFRRYAPDACPEGQQQPSAASAANLIADCPQKHRLAYVFPEDKYPLRHAKFKEVIETGQIAYLNDETLNQYFESVFCPVLTADGKVGKVIIYIRDVTNIRKIEQVKHLAALGQLSVIISHEIRNPLGAISLNLEHLESQQAISPAFQRVFGNIVKGVQRIDGVINGILDFARPIPPKLKENDIHAVISSSLMSVDFECGKNNIQICEEFADLEDVVMIDADQIHHVFVNLFTNAIQAMELGGKLTVSSRQKASTVEICISDTGSGIAPEDIPQIFEPFFTRKTKGTGLGLAIVSRILQQHHATITVQSQVGVGTAFTICFSASRNERKTHVKIKG